jgi:hypothetical protein
VSDGAHGVESGGRGQGIVRHPGLGASARVYPAAGP